MRHGVVSPIYRNTAPWRLRVLNPCKEANMTSKKVFEGLPLAFVAVIAAALGASATASASLFNASKTGNLSGHSLNTDLFMLKAGSVACKRIEANGTVTETASETLRVTLTLSECAVFGFIMGVAVSPVEYLFMSNGTADLTKVVTSKAPLCKVTMPAQNGLGTMTYKNSGKGIEIEENVTGIQSEGQGSTCEYVKKRSGH